MKLFAVDRWDAAELVAPYNAEFVADLKRAVPASYRTYDPEQRSWIVESTYLSEALRIARHYFEIERLTAQAEIQSHRLADCERVVANAYPDHTRLYVLPNAPRDVIHSAYRALAREHHPDLVGARGHGPMVEINAAFERLRGWHA
jgi:hypothetical protein